MLHSKRHESLKNESSKNETKDSGYHTNNVRFSEASKNDSDENIIFIEKQFLDKVIKNMNIKRNNQFLVKIKEKLIKRRR